MWDEQRDVSQTKNDVFKGSAAFQVSHLNNLESLSLEW